MPSSFVSNIRVICYLHRACHTATLLLTAKFLPDSVFAIKNRVSLVCDAETQDLAATGRGLGRPFFLLRLRASADFSFAFWPGGMKNACFFASLMISSVMTFRLNRRKALSIDSPGLTVTTAIYISTLRFLLSTEPLIKHV